MNEEFQKLCDQLDKDNPSWITNMASQDDLVDMVRGYATRDHIKARLVRRLFHPVLNAAISCGIVSSTKGEAS